MKNSGHQLTSVSDFVLYQRERITETAALTFISAAALLTGGKKPFCSMPGKFGEPQKMQLFKLV
ncbi:hypothetical protein [Clostridium transplantifaecale]|uniref:hypothetical protein n=1 Tax=Clostridium transplantifaecale TaxID=2479838 RepID=UPI000F62EEE5|nr:hypothetical protein [Clostridium transplantifaecale]